MLRVTFVCTGNTCRSPMAQGLFAELLKERNIDDISCRSCGLYAFPGDEATPQAVRAAHKYGADISAHRSTPLTRYLIDDTDVFVCMTASHAAALRTAAPEHRILVLGGGIPDPYGGDDAVYEACAEAIHHALRGLLDALTMRVVPMEERHIAQIAALEQTCFSAPWSEDSIRAELTNETAHFLTAESGGRCFGYVGVHEVAGEGYIANLAVLPNARRYGVAAALLDAAEAGARERGCAFLSLEVRKSNAAAIALYQKRGYQPAGERRRFYSAPPEDALIMTLRFGENCGAAEGPETSNQEEEAT